MGRGGRLTARMMREQEHAKPSQLSGTEAIHTTCILTRKTKTKKNQKKQNHYSSQGPLISKTKETIVKTASQPPPPSTMFPSWCKF